MAQQMVTELANNGANDDNQQQKQQKQLLQQYLLQPSHTIDVRMKRHPELQPFVPIDRDRVVAYKGPTKITTNYTNDAKSSPRPKKCVSMTRLNQLAQPKRVFKRNPITTLPSSSLSSSTTTSSSLRSNKNYSQPQSGNQILKPAPTLPKAVKKEQNNDSNLTQELSKLSISSKSDSLAGFKPDNCSENLTNGINSERSFGSLLNEIEASLIADGVVKTATPPSVTKLSREDEERRLRAEEELREAARKELEEREKRNSIVDSILSKINQSS